MAVQVTITATGRMSLPADIRKRLGLANGGTIYVEETIQRAHYVEGRRVVQPLALTEAARSIGLEAEAFGQALEIVTVAEHIATTRRLMQQAGLQGFPSFVMEHDGELARVQHEPFYGRPEAFLHTVEALANALSAP